MAPQTRQERLIEAMRIEAQGLTGKAERVYRSILETSPRETTALMRLGLLLSARGAFDKAAPMFRRAVLAGPADVAARMNLAAALLRLGDEAGAIDAYAEAVKIDPAHRDARLKLAYRLRFNRRLDEAAGHYQWLVERNSRDGLARWNLASIAGLTGDFDAAFAGFAHPHAMRRADLPRGLPLWTGAPLEGRRILLEAEQGLGDAIMFARLAPLVRSAGGYVILRGQVDLQGILAKFDGVDAFVLKTEPLPAADVWFPLSELAALFGAEATFAAASGPYLFADPDRAAAWKKRLPSSDRLRVGLVWAGGAGHPEDSLRSMPLSVLLRSLADVEGVELFSMQKGPSAAQADASELIRIDRDLHDLTDTAALLSQIDLVISVDTSTMHLAGAVGAPVWGLLAFMPDWRWSLDRSDSPWYPSLRMFRQPRPYDWSAVARNVADALRERVNERRGRPAPSPRSEQGSQPNRVARSGRPPNGPDR